MANARDPVFAKAFKRREFGFAVGAKVRSRWRHYFHASGSRLADAHRQLVLCTKMTGHVAAGRGGKTQWALEGVV